MYGCMDVCMDGWTYVRTYIGRDVWMYGCMYVWMDGRTYVRT